MCCSLCQKYCCMLTSLVLNLPNIFPGHSYSPPVTDWSSCALESCPRHPHEAPQRPGKVSLLGAFFHSLLPSMVFATAYCDCLTSCLDSCLDSARGRHSRKVARIFVASSRQDHFWNTGGLRFLLSTGSDYQRKSQPCVPFLPALKTKSTQTIY